MYDYLVVGAGLYGAVFAHEAHRAGKKVLVLEKREHIAGNIYTQKVAGTNVHQYGAHIFHTNNKSIWDYVNQFARFNDFLHSPVANYKGKIYSLPFNMHTFQEIWGVTTPEEVQKKITEQRRSVALKIPRNLEEQAISMVGTDIYEKLIKGYTEKQWGRPCHELPSFIIRRLPLRFTYDNNYFDALYQGIPIGGYTKMIENMLEDIEVRLGVDYLDDKETWNSLANKVVYTGAIDAYYDYCFGELEYRSLSFLTEILAEDTFQDNAVVNYTDCETPWTRIIEHKWFEFGKNEEGELIKGTVISREYSVEWKKGEEPFYPINDKKNNSLYMQYKQLADGQEKVMFGGRLGEYKYYDMDIVIERALEKVKKEDW